MGRDWEIAGAFAAVIAWCYLVAKATTEEPTQMRRMTSAVVGTYSGAVLALMFAGLILLAG